MIFDFLANTLKNKALDTIASQTGLDNATSENTLNSALPFILSALGSNVKSSKGAESLFEAVEEDHDGSVLEDLSSALSDPAKQTEGKKILDHVFQGHKESAYKALATEAGIDESQAEKVLSMLAPVIMGKLGKEQTEQTLDQDALTKLLTQEKNTIDSMLGNMSKKLIDANGDGSVIDDLIRKAKDLIDDIVD